MNRNAQIRIANAIKRKDNATVIALIKEHCTNGHWKEYGERFAMWLISDKLDAAGNVQKLPFTLFMQGNSKLPFYAFSVLPLITCSGMGACAQWCYSLKAWRYPAAFFRQCMNTVLVLNHKDILAAEFNKLSAKRGAFDFRLYVDGDFDSIDTLRFWMELLANNPNVRAYGYSKSWQHFIDYRANGFTFPSNYVLNISGGSRFDSNSAMKATMLTLSCTRGEFVAMEAKTDPRKDFKVHRNELLSQMDGKRFVCPGKCGACVLIGGNNVHACGSKAFNGVKIAIGLH